MPIMQKICMPKIETAIFKHITHKHNRYTGREQYNGERDMESMMSYVMDSLPPSPVIALFEPSFKKAVAEIERPWVVSFCYKNDGQFAILYRNKSTAIAIHLLTVFEESSFRLAVSSNKVAAVT